MILTAILIDRTFPMQTEETYEAPFKAKLGAFNALEEAIDIDSLDFVLAYSSIVGLTGNAGQTNYSRCVLSRFFPVPTLNDLQREHCLGGLNQEVQECRDHPPTHDHRYRVFPDHGGH